MIIRVDDFGAVPNDAAILKKKISDLRCMNFHQKETGYILNKKILGLLQIRCINYHSVLKARKILHMGQEEPQKAC